MPSLFLHCLSFPFPYSFPSPHPLHPFFPLLFLLTPFFFLPSLFVILCLSSLSSFAYTSFHHLFVFVASTFCLGVKKTSLSLLSPLKRTTYDHGCQHSPAENLHFYYQACRPGYHLSRLTRLS